MTKTLAFQEKWSASRNASASGEDFGPLSSYVNPYKKSTRKLCRNRAKTFEAVGEKGLGKGQTFHSVGRVQLMVAREDSVEMTLGAPRAIASKFQYVVKFLDSGSSLGYVPA